jgi:hypothetical protein
LDRIQDRPVFSNNSTCPQAHPSLQLVDVLTRLGANGTIAGVSKLQAIFSIGTGSPIIYFNSILQVSLDMKDEWVICFNVMAWALNVYKILPVKYEANTK